MIKESKFSGGKQEAAARVGIFPSQKRVAL